MLLSYVKIESDNRNKFKLIVKIWKSRLFFGWIFWSSKTLYLFIYDL